MTRQTFVSGGTNSHAGTIASPDDSMTTGDPLRAFWLFVRHLGTHHDRCHHHVW
ncbi:unnamed protein product [Brassica rapa subsp. narinosa]